MFASRIPTAHRTSPTSRHATATVLQYLPIGRLFPDPARVVRTAVRLERLLAPGDREPDRDVYRRQASQSSCSPCRCISATAEICSRPPRLAGKVKRRGPCGARGHKPIRFRKSGARGRRAWRIELAQGGPRTPGHPPPRGLPAGAPRTIRCIVNRCHCCGAARQPEAAEPCRNVHARLPDAVNAALLRYPKLSLCANTRWAVAAEVTRLRCAVTGR